MDTPAVESYTFGEIMVDGQVYRKDLIIFPGRVRTDWWRKEGHSLAIEDLEEVLEDPPDVLIVGRGAYGRMEIPPETRKRLEAKGIEVIAAVTPEAVAAYNRVRDTKNAVAALHLTC